MDRPTTARIVLLMCVLAAACTAAPRVRPVKGGDVDTGLGSLTEARKYLEGHWTLLSFEVIPTGGASIPVPGQGSLVYDAYGNLTINIKVEDATIRTLDAAGVSLRQGTMSSSGRTAVDLQNKTLTYILDKATTQAAAGGPLALSLPRHWEVRGDVLTLSTVGADGKPLTIGRWQKQPKQ